MQRASFLFAANFGKHQFVGSLIRWLKLRARKVPGKNVVSQVFGICISIREKNRARNRVKLLFRSVIERRWKMGGWRANEGKKKREKVEEGKKEKKKGSLWAVVRGSTVWGNENSQRRVSANSLSYFALLILGSPGDSRRVGNWNVNSVGPPRDTEGNLSLKVLDLSWLPAGN